MFLYSKWITTCTWLYLLTYASTPYQDIGSQQQSSNVSYPGPSSISLQLYPTSSMSRALRIPCKGPVVWCWMSVFGVCAQSNTIAVFLFQFQWALALYTAIVPHCWWFLASVTWVCVIYDLCIHGCNIHNCTTTQHLLLYILLSFVVHIAVFCCTYYMQVLIWLK